MLDWLFGRNKPQKDHEYDAIDFAFKTIGYLWIGQDIGSPPPNPHMKNLLVAFGDRGQRDDNLYALIDRDNPRKRFVIHNYALVWRLDLWYGTLNHGYPPDLRDEDGVEFFEHDAMLHASIHVMIFKDQTKRYKLSYYDNTFGTFPETHTQSYFIDLTQLLQAIDNLKQYIEAVDID